MQKKGPSWARTSLICTLTSTPLLMYGLENLTIVDFPVPKVSLKIRLIFMMKCLSCWKKLDVDQGQAFKVIIRDAYNSTHSNQNVWRKQNILSLARFVRLEDIFKLRGCYLTAKIYPSDIVRLEEEDSSSSQNDSSSPIDQF